MKIGDRIKAVAKAKNLSQNKLAFVLHISSGNMSELIKGNNMPSAKTLALLSKHMDVNINWLLTGKGEMFLDQQKSESYNNVPARTREAEQIKALEEDIKDLKKNIRDLEAECKELSKENRQLNTQLINRLQELLDAKDLIYKTLS